MMKDNSKNQQGMVSIMVTMIMILVISLIVLGFSQVIRRNQREALDRQLGTQAYYAAETGVNDAIGKLVGDSANGIPPYLTVAADNTSCTNFINAGTPAQQLTNKKNLDPSGTGAVSYTCLLVNGTPLTLTQSPLKQQANTVWPLINSTPIGTLHFTWASRSGTSTPPSNCNDGPGIFSPISPGTSGGSPCNFGVLRIDLLQFDNKNPGDPAIAGPDQAASLAKYTVTIYAQPTFASSSTGSPANTISDFSNPATRARVVQCKISGTTCTVDISLTGGAVSKSYYTRLTMLYEDSDSVTVSANDTTGAQVPFQDAQAVIDSTGKAQDVLRRIQVRTPLTTVTNNTSLPTNGLQSTGTICKILTGARSVPLTSGCP